LPRLNIGPAAAARNRIAARQMKKTMMRNVFRAFGALLLAAAAGQIRRR
jgi:uncharacterized membrane protein YhhN